MSKEQELKKVVAFYRTYKSHCSFEGGYFKVADAEIINPIDIEKLPFEQLSINSQPAQKNDSFSVKQGDVLSFTLCQPALAFENIERLIGKHKPINKGVMPKDFYLIDSNLLYSELEDETEPNLCTLVLICKFISFLKSVLPHTESTETHLNFVLFSRAKETKKLEKITFSSKFDEQDLSVDLSKLNLLLELEENDDLHSYERITVFNNSLYELAGKAHDNKHTFTYILKHFDKLIELYKNNYDTYINNFHLEEFKKEIVESYSKFSDEIDVKVEHLAIKVLAVPAISTAILFLKNGSSNTFLIGSILTVVLLITFLQSDWTADSLLRIEQSINDIYKKFDNKNEQGAEFVSTSPLMTQL
jgi:hypothetical protein